MPPLASKQQQQLDLLHQILDLAARLDERQKTMEGKVDRIDKAIYGNGGPGLRSQVDGAIRRIDEIETFEKSWPIAGMDKDLTVIMKRHEEEDKQAAAKAEEKRLARNEMRRFQWGVAGTLVAVLFDIILHVFKLF